MEESRAIYPGHVSAEKHTAVDLEIHVTTLKSGGLTRLSYELRSGKLGYPDGRVRIPGPEIQGRPEEYQAKLLGTIEKLNRRLGDNDSLLDASEVQSTLESLGRYLYRDLFSSGLCDEYRRFREKVTTLLIVSDEPWIPWELVKPEKSRGGEVVFEDPFLCQKFELSRWLLPGFPPPPARLGVTRVVCIEAGEPVRIQPLKHAKEECEFIAELAEEKSIDHHPVPNATFKTVWRALRRGGNGWIHFVGHGEHDSSGARLLMADGRSWRPRDLDVFMRSHFQRDRPLVFLNSCQTGRQDFTLTRLGGWAPRLIEAGCGAFIAPQWSVGDKTSFAFAKAFYKAIADGETIAKATQTARESIRKEFAGRPTWLAYSLYGHPGAEVVFGEAGVAELRAKGAPVELPPPKKPFSLSWVLGALLAIAVVLSGIWWKTSQEHPKNIEDCIASARTWLSSGNLDKTLEIAEQCRRLDASPRNEAELALLSAEAYYGAGDSTKALYSARHAAAKAETARAFFLVGQAHLREAYLLAEVFGDSPDFETRLRKARDAFVKAESVKDLFGVCMAASDAYSERQLWEARRVLETCREVYRSRA